MSKLSLFAGLAAAVVLSACGTAEIDAVRQVETTVSPFAKALSREYRELAVFEADEMYDFIDAGEYARRGLAVARGETVAPFVLAEWNLPADQIPKLSTARARLMAALGRDARTRVPDAAADAQGKFDCWVEQQEENHQFDHIAACREAFYAALAILEDKSKPAKPAALSAPVSPPATPSEKPTKKVADAVDPDRRYVVHFAFDSSKLGGAAKLKVVAAVAAWEIYRGPVFIAGHADRAGPCRHNMGLSRRRAAAVGEALHRRGVPRHLIKSRGYGEDDPVVPTEDGVRRHANRRVEITIK
jgi:OOP family OmpA-OmpF porin